MIQMIQGEKVGLIQLLSIDTRILYNSETQLAGIRYFIHSCPKQIAEKKQGYTADEKIAMVLYEKS